MARRYRVICDCDRYRPDILIGVLLLTRVSDATLIADVTIYRSPYAVRLVLSQ